MAQGVMRSNKTRDGIAASLADNIGYLEEQMYELEQTDAAAVQAATAAATAAASAVEGAESALTEMDAVLESLSLSRASRLNKPNLLKQNYATSREMPSSAVISEEITIPAETAEEAAVNLTHTITNEAITSSYVLAGVKSIIYAIASMSNVTCTASAGSAVITIGPRNSSAAHDALTITVYLCTMSTQTVPYGDVSRCGGSSYPYLKNISGSASYPGDDTSDGLTVSVASLASADQITEPDNETYTTALQFNITANSAYGNTEWLQYYHANSSAMYYQGNTPRNYGHIDELIPGKTYTVAFWARITSGTTAWARFGWGGKYSMAPYAGVNWGGLSEWVEITGATWQRYWWTFTFNPTGDWYTETSEQVTVNEETKTRITRSYNWNKSVWFGVGRKYTATLQLCGFRLVEGGMWLPTKYDELSERVDELEDDVAADIEGAVSTARAAVQAAICETDSTTATANHAVGDVFWMNGVLYKATAAIATGETITPGTNCETTTVEALIAAAVAGVDLSSKADKASPVFTGSISLGRDTSATTGTNSFAVGTDVVASGGDAHAEGSYTRATGNSSHAEGTTSTASGRYSHAEGTWTNATGVASHAEGNTSTASGYGSHAEGNMADAGGTFAHAEGNMTIANHRSQHVFGEYNVADASTNAATALGGYVEIVGNGTEAARSNARTLDWSGNESLAGGLTLGKGTADETTITAAQLAQLLALLS